MKLFPEATNLFITNPTSGLKTDASRDSYRKTLCGLQHAYPEHQLEDFTEKDLVNWCSREDLAPATIAGYRTRIRGFFSWALWQQLIFEDPSVNLKRLVKGSFVKPVQEHRWLSTEEVTKVLDSIDTSNLIGMRDMIIARLGFTLGLRRAEIAGLTWGQVDLDRQQVTVKGKGGRLATLFLTDVSLPWFRVWNGRATEALRHSPVDEPVVPKFQASQVTSWKSVPFWWTPVGPDTISKRIRFLSNAGWAPHDMRRSYANMLQEAGYPIEEISTALRHSDLGTTQRYLERRQDAAYQAVKERGLSV